LDGNIIKCDVEVKLLGVAFVWILMLFLKYTLASLYYFHNRSATLVGNS
jgi:hypothetical protein